jgi:hypothetical protein
MPSNLPEDVAIVAISGERSMDVDHLHWLRKRFGMIIVLTNDDRDIAGCHVIRLEATGRELACLRLACPKKEGVTYYSFNSEYHPIAKPGPEKLWHSRMHFKKSNYDFISVIPFGLHQAAAGICAYKQNIFDDESINWDIYGAEEWAMTKLRGIIKVPISPMLMHMVHSWSDFPCRRWIEFYDQTSGDTLYETYVDNWDIASILQSFRSATPPRKRIGQSEKGITVNGRDVDMSPIVSEMYPVGTPVEDVIDDIQSNIGAFTQRLKDTAVGIMRDADKNPVSSALLVSCSNTISAFSRGNRPPKAIWAPIQSKLKKTRIEEVSLNLHPNPVFIPASFDDTLSHYVNFLNGENKLA